MIRIALECVMVFLLPAAIYFGYHLLMASPGKAGATTADTATDLLDGAPLVWLFALGVLLVFGTLLAFATLQDDSIDQPYAPAIFKNGQIQKGGGK